MNTKKFISLFSFLFLFVYGFPYIILPLFFFEKSDSANLLAGLTFVSIVFYLLGLNIGSNKTFKKKVLELNFNRFLKSFIIVFFLVVTVIVITAQNVPLIALIFGAENADLVIFREDFLKGRIGWEASLNYIIAIINSSFLPYLIIICFFIRHKRRYLFTGMFFLYSLSFLEKAYFLKIAIPLFFFYFFTKKHRWKFIFRASSVILLILTIMFYITRSEDSIGYKNYNSYYSVNYVNPTPIQSLIWRSGVVPVATAIDALELFEKSFKNKHLYGSTSSLISIVFGIERVNFERILYQQQFGGVKTGNANQVFLVDAYINFGIVGVILISFIVGKIVRGFILKKNLALITIIPLFLYNLFNAGFIGVMLSEGFLLFFFFIHYSKFSFTKNQ